MAEENGSSIGWFLAGLGLGALVGILYAPKSGRETRDALLEGANQGRDYVVTRGREARQQAGQWVERGRETYAKQKDQFTSAVEAGRQAYREATSGTPGPQGGQGGGTQG